MHPAQILETLIPVFPNSAYFIIDSFGKDNQKIKLESHLSTNFLAEARFLESFFSFKGLKRLCR